MSPLLVFFLRLVEEGFGPTMSPSEPRFSSFSLQVVLLQTFPILVVKLGMPFKMNFLIGFFPVLTSFSDYAARAGKGNIFVKHEHFNI